MCASSDDFLGVLKNINNSLKDLTKAVESQNKKHDKLIKAILKANGVELK